MVDKGEYINFQRRSSETSSV